MSTIPSRSRSRSSSSSKSSSSSCSSCSSSSGSSSSTNSDSSFTSFSSSSSSSSSSGSSSSRSSRTSLAHANSRKSKKSAKPLLHSQSCHDICRERRAFEDDEDTTPLLDGDGHVYRSATMKDYFSSDKKCKDAEGSCHRPSRKGNLQKKNAQTENIRKAKSMEVLPRKTDQTEEERLDDEETKRRKEETKKKILKDKMKFSAFLNEITQQVFSPSKLQTLGVTNVTRAVSPTASPSKSSDLETKRNRCSPRLSRDANSVSSCSPSHSCKHSKVNKHSTRTSDLNKHHHHHKATKNNSTHPHHSVKGHSFSSTGSSKSHCPRVEHGHRKHKKHPSQTSSHVTDENSMTRKRNMLRHQSPSPVPHQHGHHDQCHDHHCHSPEHHHHHHHHRSHKRKSPHHSLHKDIHHTHYLQSDNPHPETHHHHSSQHSPSNSRSPQPRSHHSPSPHQHHPRLDHYAQSESCHQSPSPSHHHQHDDGDHGRPSAHHHSPNSRTKPHSYPESHHHSPSHHGDHQIESCTCSSSSLHQHHHGDHGNPSMLKCQHQGHKESHRHHPPFNRSQQSLSILNSPHSKTHYSSLPEIHDSFSHPHHSTHEEPSHHQDHHHHPAPYNSHDYNTADLHHSSSEHHLPHPHHHSHDHHRSTYSGVSTHCEPKCSKSSSSDTEKQPFSHSDHHHPHQRQSHSGRSKIPEHPKSHHHTHHLDTQFCSEGHHHHSHPDIHHTRSHHLQAPQYHSHSKSHDHSHNSPESHKTHLHHEHSDIHHTHGHHLQAPQYHFHSKSHDHSPNSPESHKTQLHHHEHLEVHQYSYSESPYHHSSKSKIPTDSKLKSHFNSDSHIYSHTESHTESNLQHKHPESHSSFPSESLPSHKESHHDAHKQPISCLDCLESHQYHSQAREHHHQGDHPNLRHSPVGQQATSPCSVKSDSSRNSTPTSHDDHSTTRYKVTPTLQDALVKSDNPFKPFSPSVAPPPFQFMDTDHYKGLITEDEQALGPVPEEGESDWSEMGEERKHSTMSSLEAGHHRSHCQQNHNWWVKADQYRRGDGDTESESGGEESTRGHSLQVPHFQFTLQPESKPVTDAGLINLNSTGPAEEGYQISIGRQLCSPIRILSASQEGINSIGLPQLELIDVHDSRVSAAKDCAKDVGHDWKKVDGAKGAGRSGQETVGNMASLESAQKMLNHFIQEGERTQL